MSRSRKKKPYIAITTCDSEKDCKRFANRSYRRKAKQALIREKEVLPLMRETSSVWDFGKDGKYYRANPCPNWMRK